MASEEMNEFSLFGKAGFRRQKSTTERETSTCRLGKLRWKWEDVGGRVSGGLWVFPFNLGF